MVLPVGRRARARLRAHQKMKRTRDLLSGDTGHCGAGMGSNPVPFIWEALLPAIRTWVHSGILQTTTFYILSRLLFLFLHATNPHEYISLSNRGSSVSCWLCLFVMSRAWIYLLIVDHISGLGLCSVMSTKPIKLFCLCVVAHIYPSQLHIG